MQDALSSHPTKKQVHPAAAKQKQSDFWHSPPAYRPSSDEMVIHGANAGSKSVQWLRPLGSKSTLAHHTWSQSGHDKTGVAHTLPHQTRTKPDGLSSTVKRMLANARRVVSEESASRGRSRKIVSHDRGRATDQTSSIPKWLQAR